jgi:hypothetical protein
MSNMANMHKVSPSPTPYLNITVSSLYKNKGKERNSQDRCADRRKSSEEVLHCSSISTTLVDLEKFLDVDNVGDLERLSM